MGSLKPTWPVAMEPSLWRFPHGVYTIVMLSFLFPGLVRQRDKQEQRAVQTLNRVCLGQLCAVAQQLGWNRVPRLALAQAQVDVCTRQLVGMKPVPPSACLPADLPPRIASHHTSSSQPYWIRSSSCSSAPGRWRRQRRTFDFVLACVDAGRGRVCVAGEVEHHDVRCRERAASGAHVLVQSRAQMVHSTTVAMK